MAAAKQPEILQPGQRAPDFNLARLDDGSRTLGELLADGPVQPCDFDAAYALDVIEHVPLAEEHAFLGELIGSLATNAVLILGSPSRESQAYASEISRAGHVNCKTAEGLAALLRPQFKAVLSFSMNDEVVHTGFAPMAHYLFAVGIR